MLVKCMGAPDEAREGQRVRESLAFPTTQDKAIGLPHTTRSLQRAGERGKEGEGQSVSECVRAAHPRHQQAVLPHTHTIMSCYSPPSWHGIPPPHQGLLPPTRGTESRMWFECNKSVLSIESLQGLPSPAFKQVIKNRTEQNRTLPSPLSVIHSCIKKKEGTSIIFMTTRGDKF